MSLSVLVRGGSHPDAWKLKGANGHARDLELEVMSEWCRDLSEPLCLHVPFCLPSGILRLSRVYALYRAVSWAPPLRFFLVCFTFVFVFIVKHDSKSSGMRTF